jgi:hypothetical protein
MTHVTKCNKSKSPTIETFLNSFNDILRIGNLKLMIAKSAQTNIRRQEIKAKLCIFEKRINIGALASIISAMGRPI